MGSNEDKPSNKGAVLLICAAMVLIPLLYIASIGPAHLIVDFQLNGHLNRSQFSSHGQQICEVVYWPICQACEQSELIANSVSWYLGLWRR